MCRGDAADAGHRAGLLAARVGSAREGQRAKSTGGVNHRSLPEINTATLIYTQESVAKYARSAGAPLHPLGP